MAAEGEKLDLNLLFTIDDALDNLLLPYSFDLSIMAEIDILLHDNRNPEQPMYRIAKQKGICLI